MSFFKIPECYAYAVQDDITVISRDFSMKHASYEKFNKQSSSPLLFVW